MIKENDNFLEIGSDSINDGFMELLAKLDDTYTQYNYDLVVGDKVMAQRAMDFINGIICSLTYLFNITVKEQHGSSDLMLQIWRVDVYDNKGVLLMNICPITF